MKPMMIRITTIILIFLLSVVCISSKQPPTTSAIAEQRAKEIIQMINSGNRSVVRAYIRQNFTPAALKEQRLEAWVNSISGLYDFTRGLELESVKESKPNSVKALARAKLTGLWRQLTIELEPDSSHLVKTLDWGAFPTPADKLPANKLTEKEIVRELDAFMQKIVQADVFSGIVLLAKDKRILYKKVFGQANKDFGIPNRLDTKFGLGSLNKMFTSVAIAQLVEQGRLSYDDQLSKFVPDFPNKEAAEKIKIKHLLTHTSGLGDYSVKASRQGARTIDEFMKLIKSYNLAFEPGTDQSYSNAAFLVLGKVIEQVTGRSYYDYVRENVYQRAGMINTDVYDLDLVNKNLAAGYEKEYSDQGIIFRNNVCDVGYGSPAGGGFSTADDMLNFSIALRTGKLVGNDYVKVILSPKPELKSSTYGYGINVLKGIAGHSGGDTGVNTNFEMFLNEGYTIVILSNYGGAMQQVNRKIRDLLLGGK